MNEIDAFKNVLAKELETTKHELKLEYAKQSIWPAGRSFKIQLVSPRNGLCLNALDARAFDKGLITK